MPNPDCNSKPGLSEAFSLQTRLRRQDKVDGSGMTALHMAIRNDHVDICHVLMERRADLNKLDTEGAAQCQRETTRGNLDANTSLAQEGSQVQKRPCCAHAAASSIPERSEGSDPATTTDAELPRKKSMSGLTWLAGA